MSYAGYQFEEEVEDPDGGTKVVVRNVGDQGNLEFTQVGSCKLPESLMMYRRLERTSDGNMFPVINAVKLFHGEIPKIYLGKLLHSNT